MYPQYNIRNELEGCLVNNAACSDPVNVIADEAQDWIANFQYELTEDGYPVYELREYTPSLRPMGLFVLKDGNFTPLSEYAPTASDVAAFDAWLERGVTLCG